MTLDISNMTEAGRSSHIEWLRAKIPHITDASEFVGLDGRTLEWLTESLGDYFSDMCQLREDLAEERYAYEEGLGDLTRELVEAQCRLAAVRAALEAK